MTIEEDLLRLLKSIDEVALENDASKASPTITMKTISGSGNGLASASQGLPEMKQNGGAIGVGGSQSVHPERNVLDKFATAYIPNWLHTIPPALYDVPLPPLPLAVDPGQAAEVFPLPLLRDVYPPVCGLFGLNVTTSPATDSTVPALRDDAVSYLHHFTALLAMEQEELRQAAGRQVIYGVPITRQSVTSGGPQSNPVMWQLRIPGTREDSPRLFIDDRLRIRGLYRPLQTATEAAVQARITGTIKREGLVFFECPSLSEMDTHLRHHPSGGSPEYTTAFPALQPALQQRNHAPRGGPEYMVEFYPSTDALITMHSAVSHIPIASLIMSGLQRTYAHLLRRVTSCLVTQTDSTFRTPTIKWLFPRIEDIKETMSRTDFELKPFARRNDVQSLSESPVNEQQKLAIKRIVGSHRTVPYLIAGPPGTGKTKTMVELVLQILMHHEDAHILLTAPSNPAADTLALRLAPFLDNKSLLRLQSSTRTFAETPNEVLTYSCIKNNSFVVPAWADLLRYRVVVVDCLDAELLTIAKATNAEMLRLEHQTLRAIGRKKAKMSLQVHWTHLLVDEAGQASEPEMLIPLAAVMIGPEEADMLQGREPQVVICGDIKQLPAIVTSSRARGHGLDVSLMERLQERTIYDLKANVQTESVNIIRLVNNYRSHPGILLLPSTIFYDDSLEPVAKVTLSQWSDLPNKRLPMLIKGIEANEDWIDEGASFFNMSEIAEVVRTVKSLATGRADGYRQSEIGVITPWREQVWRIRLKLREAGYHDINVGNVEAYQGAEYRCVILSCVRSRDRFLQSDQDNGMGLINEPKRFNVAITRAKELMVIIGNMNCHKADSHWAALLQIASRHQFYVGPQLKDFEVTGEYISRLESRIYPEMMDGPNDESMQGLLISGSVAREALMED